MQGVADKVTVDEGDTGPELDGEAPKERLAEGVNSLREGEGDAVGEGVVVPEPV